jgi:hypothetical protein
MRRQGASHDNADGDEDGSDATRQVVTLVATDDCGLHPHRRVNAHIPVAKCCHR